MQIINSLFFKKSLVTFSFIFIITFASLHAAEAFSFKSFVKKAASTVAAAVTTTVATVNAAVVQPVVQPIVQNIIQPVIQNVIKPVVSAVVSVVNTVGNFLSDVFSVTGQLVNIGLSLGSDQKRIIVKWKDGSNTYDIEQSMERFFADDSTKKILKQHNSENVGVFVMNTSKNVFAIYNRVRLVFDKNVEYVEEDKQIDFPYPINDPLLFAQWYINKIEAPKAWEKNRGEGVIIAVLDTGVNCNHEDLRGKCIDGKDIVNNTNDGSDIQNHGTWAAGTIVANVNNAAGIAGVAHNAKIIPVRITANSVTGSAYISDMANGVNYAVSRGAKIINISYGGFNSQTMELAARNAFANGSIVVMSAGNSNINMFDYNSPYMTVVSSSDKNDDKSSFSNYGSAIDIIAPGTNILTTSRTGGYGTVNGTSFSAPITSAVLGLIKSTNPNLTPAQALNILHTSSDDLGFRGWDNINGWGRVNARKAVDYAKNAGYYNSKFNTFSDTSIYRSEFNASDFSTASVLSAPSALPEEENKTENNVQVNVIEANNNQNVAPPTSTTILSAPSSLTSEENKIESKIQGNGTGVGSAQQNAGAPTVNIKFE